MISSRIKSCSKVEPLRKLIEGRKRLSDLLSKMDGNDRLEELLQDIVQNTGSQQQLSAALGLDKPAASGETKEESNE